MIVNNMPLNIANTFLQSVAITQCGTFALIGSSMGSIDVFNLQSGQHRQCFPARGLKSRRTGELGLANGSQEKNIGHTKAVTGLVVDSLNRTAISCGLDGKVKVRYTTPQHNHNTD